MRLWQKRDLKMRICVLELYQKSAHFSNVGTQLGIISTQLVNDGALIGIFCTQLGNNCILTESRGRINGMCCWTNNNGRIVRIGSLLLFLFLSLKTMIIIEFFNKVLLILKSLKNSFIFIKLNKLSPSPSRFHILLCVMPSNDPKVQWCCRQGISMFCCRHCMFLTQLFFGPCFWWRIPRRRICWDFRWPYANFRKEEEFKWNWTTLKWYLIKKDYKWKSANGQRRR